MLPAVVCLCVVSVVLLLYAFPTSPLIRFVRFVQMLLGRRRRRTSENNPPYTSSFIKPVHSQHYSAMKSWFGQIFRCCKFLVLSSVVNADQEVDKSVELSLAAKMNGWVIKEEKVTGKKFKMKEWRTSGYDNRGVRHEAGTLKKTWECVRDDGLHSYRVDQNPKYKDAMALMYSGKGRKRRR